MKKLIVVCGDSVCSADRHRPNTHFSELLNDYKVINIARGGISNIGIAFQLQCAVKLRPNAIIFSTTDSSRIDIPIKNRKFVPPMGLKNFIYPYKADSSTGSEHVGGLDATIMSDTVQDIITKRWDFPTNLTNLINVEAIKSYYANLYNYELKSITDEWMLGFWEYTMKELTIPFIKLEHQGIGREIYDYIIDHPDKITQCVYHTDEKTQTVVATNLNTILTRLLSS